MQRKLTIEPVDPKKRRKALDEFDQLLNMDTKEEAWQHLFDENPFILFDALPIKFDVLYRQVPLVSGVPDYVFYRSAGHGIAGDFGVIELKRNSQSLFHAYSTKILVPSGALRVAQQEVTLHLDAIQKGGFLDDKDSFVAGNRRYAFIIMGNSAEIVQKCGKDTFLEQFHQLLPPGFHLYTFSEIFERFRSEVVLESDFLSVKRQKTPPSRITRSFRVMNKMGIHARPACLLVKELNRFGCDVFVSKDGECSNAKSIMAWMMLNIVFGSKITVTAEGRDAEQAIEAVAGLIGKNFCED